jgi:hypothetical protein
MLIYDPTRFDLAGIVSDTVATTDGRSQSRYVLKKNIYIYIINLYYIFCHFFCYGNPGFNFCVQQEEDSLYQQTGLKFEEETSKMLHLEHGFLWC